jgi:hypothetical protein
VVERLAASKVGLSSMELVSWKVRVECMADGNLERSGRDLFGHLHGGNE